MPPANLCLGVNSLAAYAEGGLPQAEVHRVDAHVDGCQECRSDLSALALAITLPPHTPELSEEYLAGLEIEPGLRFGRYVALTELGRGAMGIVMRAYDPELQRAVAIKVVRPELWHHAKESVRQGLLREAQAMARLTSGNVVTVHDVVTSEDGLALAMELVEGGTLRMWLGGEEERSWQEILATCLQAGRGLEAAHSAQIIHRDFKPDNVLCSNDGRVLVTDFGLAVLGDESTKEKNAFAGTPVYMAPELHGGAEASVESDQFSYCVSAYEALYGERPFAGTTIEELLEDVRAGKVRDAPARTQVPSKVRQALLLGLSAKPEDRHDSMTDLLATQAAALNVEAASRRRRWFLGAAVGGVALAALAYNGLYRAPRARVATCVASSHKLGSVWNDEVRQEVSRSLVETGHPFAKEYVGKASALLAQQVKGLASAQRTACEATHLRSEQSLEVLSARISCFDSAQAELGEYVELLRTTKRASLDHALLAAYALTRPEACSSEEALTHLGNLAPATPTMSALRQPLTKARLLYEAGRYDESRSLLAELSYPGDSDRVVQTQMLRLQANLEFKKRDLEAFEETAHRLLVLAQAAGSDRLVAEAALDLGKARAMRGAPETEKDRWTKVAAAALEHMGGDPVLESRLASLKASIATWKGESEVALDEALKSRELLQSVLPSSHPGMAGAESLLATQLGNAGRHEEALEAALLSISILEASLGPEHPKLLHPLSRMATIYNRLGRVADAVAAYQRALAIGESSHGTDSMQVAVVLNNLGSAVSSSGNPDKGLAHQERALAIYETVLGPEHQRVGGLLVNLGSSYRRAGKLPESEARLKRAVVVLEATIGEHSTLRIALTALANTLCEQERCSEGIAHIERALVIAGKSREGEHEGLVGPLTTLGYLLIGSQSFALAIPHLERALRIVEGDPHGLRRAAVSFHLARALWGANTDRKRAVRLAENAKRALDEGEAKDPVFSQDIEEWLATEENR